MASRARGALDALRSLWTDGSLCASGANGTLWAFDDASVDPVAVFVGDIELAINEIRVAGSAAAGGVSGEEFFQRVVRAEHGDALAGRAGWSCFALDALRSLGSDGALGPERSLRSGGTGNAGFAGCAG